MPLRSGDDSPLVCDVLPDAMQNKQCLVRVLNVERTFWEKTTILHMLHHASDAGKLRPGMSRHYYDVDRMAQRDVFSRAIGSIGLLDRVAQHKGVFFKAAWAKYDTAHPGTLRLTPNEAIIQSLKADYRAMQEMFFKEPPPFDEILSYLPGLESQINRVQQ